MTIDEPSPQVAHSDLKESWDDLDQHMIGDDLPEVIEDHATAERMVRSVARRRRELARSQELAEAQIERVREWLDAERHRLATDYFERCLATYHESLLAQDDRLKTISLPSGRLKARQGQPGWDVDADRFVAWAIGAIPDLVRVKHEPDKAAMKKLLSVDGVNAVSDAGEVVPGVTVTPAEISFRVEVDE